MESGDLMSLNDKMTGLMNVIRSMSGTTDKLSVDDATSIASSAGQWGVRVPNLIENTSSDLQRFNGVTSDTNGDSDTKGFVIHSTGLYSLSTDICNPNVDLTFRLVFWDSSWNWAGESNKVTVPKGTFLKTIKLFYTIPDDLKAPIYARLYANASKNIKISFGYKRMMLNAGNPAPYTSSTKSYTVDSLAERLTALENKVGGVTDLTLTALPLRRLEVAA